MKFYTDVTDMHQDLLKTIGLLICTFLIYTHVFNFKYFYRYQILLLKVLYN